MWVVSICVVIMSSPTFLSDWLLFQPLINQPIYLATHLLVEGLLRVPESSWHQLHGPGDSTLLHWGLSQPPLHNTLAKTWVVVVVVVVVVVAGN